MLLNILNGSVGLQDQSKIEKINISTQFQLALKNKNKSILLKYILFLYYIIAQYCVGSLCASLAVLLQREWLHKTSVLCCGGVWHWGIGIGSLNFICLQGPTVWTAGCGVLGVLIPFCHCQYWLFSAICTVLGFVWDQTRRPQGSSHCAHG